MADSPVDGVQNMNLQGGDASQQMINGMSFDPMSDYQKSADSAPQMNGIGADTNSFSLDHVTGNDLLGFDSNQGQGQGQVMSPPDLSDSKNYEFDPLSSNSASFADPPSQDGDSSIQADMGMQSPPPSQNLDSLINFQGFSDTAASAQPQLLDIFDPLQPVANQSEESAPPANQSAMCGDSTNQQPEPVSSNPFADYTGVPGSGSPEVFGAHSNQEQYLQEIGVLGAPPPESVEKPLEDTGQSVPEQTAPGGVGEGVVLGSTPPVSSNPFVDPSLPAPGAPLDLMTSGVIQEPEVQHDTPPPPMEAFTGEDPTTKMNSEEAKISMTDDSLLVEMNTGNIYSIPADEPGEPDIESSLVATSDAHGGETTEAKLAEITPPLVESPPPLVESLPPPIESPPPQVESPPQPSPASPGVEDEVPEEQLVVEDIPAEEKPSEEVVRAPPPPEEAAPAPPAPEEVIPSPPEEITPAPPVVPKIDTAPASTPTKVKKTEKPSPRSAPPSKKTTTASPRKETSSLRSSTTAASRAKTASSKIPSPKRQKKDGASDSGIEDDKQTKKSTSPREKKAAAADVKPKASTGTPSKTSSAKKTTANGMASPRTPSSRSAASPRTPSTPKTTTTPKPTTPRTTPKTTPGTGPAKSKIGSLDNSQHTPGGGKVQITKKKKVPTATLR